MHSGHQRSEQQSNFYGMSVFVGPRVQSAITLAPACDSATLQSFRNVGARFRCVTVKFIQSPSHQCSCAMRRLLLRRASPIGSRVLHIRFHDPTRKLSAPTTSRDTTERSDNRVYSAASGLKCITLPLSNSRSPKYTQFPIDPRI
jgi:hypothetical protein